MLIRNFLDAKLQDEVIHEGKGLCRHAMIMGADVMDAPVRFINYTVIPPECSFGLHEHGNDNEFYIVLEGSGVYQQNGEEQPVKKGDIMMNAPYGAHGIVNTGSVDLALLVMEVAV